MLSRRRNSARKFCSVSCGAKHSTAERNKNLRVEMSCQQCSQEFTINRYASAARKFCSKVCKDAASLISVPYFDCNHCGEPTARKKGANNGYIYSAKYCSKKCSEENLRKEGGSTDKNGYKYSTVARKHIFEHRAIMENLIGRKLHPEETVHHRNGNKADNRPENLELWASRHCKGQRVSDLVVFAVTLIRQYPEYLEEQGFCLTKLNIDNIINLSDSHKEIGK